MNRTSRLARRLRIPYVICKPIYARRRRARLYCLI